MPNVKEYSLKNDGNLKLQKNFKAREFACHDGTDAFLVDLDNVDKLQKIRDYFNAPIKINSAYRTPAWNAKQGGASNSYHMKGQAADIVVSGVNALRVAMYAESIGCHGVIYYPLKKFTHVDTRAGTFHAICIGKNYYPEPTTALKKGSSGNAVRWVQFMLTYAGYRLTADGKFGDGTTAAVKAFQKANGLTVDGSFGAKTRAKIKEVLM